MTREYHAETQELAADSATQLPHWLSKTLGARKPKVLSTERGAGYSSSIVFLKELQTVRASALN